MGGGGCKFARCGDSQETYPQLEIYLVENYTDVPGAGHHVYTSPHLGGAFGFDSCTTSATTCYVFLPRALF